MVKIKKLAEEYKYSPFMIEQIIKNYPDDYLGVIKAFDKPAFNTIRVNTLKTTPEILKKKMERKHFRLTKTKWIDYAFNVDLSRANFKLGATHEYLKGFYYNQSLASMIPVHLLSPQPGDHVWDMCAAPGSKTTQIGQIMNQNGIIVATEIKKSRIYSLDSNIKRCGIKNCIVFPKDSSQFNSKIASNFKPNKILLDAPCTGSGIIRIDPKNKRSKDDHNIKRLSNIQKKLLKTGLKTLQPGGYLMYSTCSFHYQENEQVIAETLHNMDNIEIVIPFEDIGLPGLEKVGDMVFGYDLLKSRRLFPNIHDTDAFFYCLLKKKSKNI